MKREAAKGRAPTIREGLAVLGESFSKYKAAGRGNLPAAIFVQIAKSGLSGVRLPVATAAVSAATVESTASAVKAATTAMGPATSAMEAAAAGVESTGIGAEVSAAVEVRSPAIHVAAVLVGCGSVAAVYRPSVVVAVSAVVAVPAVPSVTIAAVISTTAVAPTVEPRTGADEEAADEVVSAVVAVRSAGVGVITVIPVGADRGSAVIAADWTYADAHRELSVGVRRCDETESQANTNKS
jgi:hypothetical protein